jgi:23S rRNA (cytidine1920-2'-O)/16S rRNA (cytidine1409-2'-O)-methyltransferase
MHPDKNTGGRVRLDLRMVELGLARSRAQARDLIRRGLVAVAGAVTTKPGAGIAPGVAIAVSGSDAQRASRGALKLIAALDRFRFPVAGIVALDIGASTGGFTEVLLERGAARVYAVDVGRGQLDVRLGHDARVVSLEGCDARRLDRVLVPEPIGAVVADVSFISLTKALPVPLSLTCPGAWMVALIKPQFEAGRGAVGKGGIVRDPAVRQRAVETVRAWVGRQADWQVEGVIASPVAGGSGNEEFLLGARRER